MTDWVTTVSFGMGFLGALFLVLGVAAARRRKLVRLTVHVAIALACFAVGLACLTLQMSLVGYRALTREDLAATIQLEPAGPLQFDVTVRLTDGRTQTYRLAGDEVYVDAHILKWKPWANVLGLHTAYELDRIAGRYHLIDDERQKPRTVHTLSTPRWVDLFTLRRKYVWLEPLVDAEYGSAAFFPAAEPMAVELRVSTTGLLFRSASYPR